MSESLKILHEYKYIHRDIKPENFVLGLDDEQDKVYLIDFGLSKKYILFNDNILFLIKIIYYH